MKRLTYQENADRLRAARKRWRRDVERRNKTYVVAESVKITPPVTLSFRKNFGGTIKFLEQLRTATIETEGSRRSVYVDLVPVKELSVPVAIVLAAEFHRWSLIKRTRLHPRNSASWDPRIRSLLADLGVFELLNTTSIDADHFDPGNITLTPLESGDRFDGQKINELQAHFQQSLEGFTSKPQVFEGLMEAAENAIAHAYPDHYEPRHQYAGHRWWGASCLDLERQRLRFFIFDQGAGIPFTLPKGPLWETILTNVARISGGLISDDAHMLRAAFEAGRTRTGLTHRGLGLQRMADVVRGADSAFLRIISGRAEIVHHFDDRIESQGLSDHIGGTLIEWNMPADVFIVRSKDHGNAAD